MMVGDEIINRSLHHFFILQQQHWICFVHNPTIIISKQDKGHLYHTCIGLMVIMELKTFIHSVVSYYDRSDWLSDGRTDRPSTVVFMLNTKTQKEDNRHFNCHNFTTTIFTRIYWQYKQQNNSNNFFTAFVVSSWWSKRNPTLNSN